MTNPQAAKEQEGPQLIGRTWTIDVCLTCGAQASYPFSCGHRRTDQPWTYPLIVKAVYPKTAQRQMSNRAGV